MWVNIIGNNFKELLVVLERRPFLIIILSLLFTSGLFMRHWLTGKEDCVEEVKILNDSIQSLHKEVFNYKFESLYYRKIIETANDDLDSVIREKIIKPLQQNND